MMEEELTAQKAFAQTLTEQMGQGLTCNERAGYFEFVNLLMQNAGLPT